MSLKLNLASVPVELRIEVEKIALKRFPRCTVEWVNGNAGFVILEIPQGDYGYSQDLDAHGLPVGPRESASMAVTASLEEDLRRFIRSQYPSEH